MSHIVQVADFIGEESYGSYTPNWGICKDEQEAAGIVSSLARVQDPQPGVWYPTEEPVYNPTAGGMIGERISFT